MNPALCVLRKCNWGACVLQTRFARVGVFQAVAAAAGRGIMGRPLLPAATQGQTRLSLLGLSNIPRWTICPGIPSWRQGSKDWKLVSQICRSCIQTKVGGLGRCSRFAIQGQRVETFPFPTPATPKISGPLRFFKKLTTGSNLHSDRDLAVDTDSDDFLSEMKNLSRTS